MTRKLSGSVATGPQLRVISQETIKPTTPTPSHLKRYNLSAMDQISPPIYMPMGFFFPDSGCDSSQKFADISRRLKYSLSETLTQYYPFTGRLKSGAYVDCNDEGVEFLEAQIKCGMSEIIKRLDEDDSFHLRFPPGLVWGSLNNDSSLVVIQLNNFDCGGIAMAVCMSHKLADGCTVGHFMFHWAAVTRQSGEQVPPRYISTSSNDVITQPEFPHVKKYWVTRRFVFHNSKIAHFKATVVESGVQNPTRVDVLVALIYKCAITAASSNSQSFGAAVLTHLVNMRPKMVPPLPETSVGNMKWNITIPIKNESEANLSALTDRIKKGKTRITRMKNLDGNEYRSRTQEFVNNYKFYLSTSVCGFPFYQVDFGWGKPIRVTTGETSLNNMFIFMDTPNGDGIEVLVSLDEQDMVTFQRELTAQCLVHSSRM